MDAPEVIFKPGLTLNVTGCADGQVYCLNSSYIGSFINSLKSFKSLVLPPGYYKSGAVLEIYNGDEISRVRMLHMLHRGQDFDRVSYERP